MDLNTIKQFGESFWLEVERWLRRECFVPYDPEDAAQKDKLETSAAIEQSARHAWELQDAELRQEALEEALAKGIPEEEFAWNPEINHPFERPSGYYIYEIVTGYVDAPVTKTNEEGNVVEVLDEEGNKVTQRVPVKSKFVNKYSESDIASIKDEYFDVSNEQSYIATAKKYIGAEPLSENAYNIETGEAALKMDYAEWEEQGLLCTEVDEESGNTFIVKEPSPFSDIGLLDYQKLIYSDVFVKVSEDPMSLEMSAYDKIGYAELRSLGYICVNIQSETPTEKYHGITPEDILVNETEFRDKIDSQVYFLVADLTNPSSFEELSRQYGSPKFILCSPSIYASVDRAEVSGAIIRESARKMVFAEIPDTAIKVSEDADESTVLLYRILQDGFLKGASDVHFDPIEGNLVIRYRIDGELENQGSYPIAMSTSLRNTLVNLAEMPDKNINKPAKGQIQMVLMTKSGVYKPISMRVNILRIKDLFSINIRFVSDTLLDMKKCLSPETYAAVMRVSEMSKGLVLVVGPTGSGKSTLIYQILREIAATNRCVLTVEDPVEMYLPGITHVNIDEKGGVTFEDVLASFLRHDPDVVLAGEIRQLDLAQKAVSMAETGHLVFSTLHTNDAISSFNRLKYMGLDQQVLADSVKVVISQRLVRRLCDHCKRPYYLSDDSELRRILPIPKGEFLAYKKVGCEHCRFTGYKGRLSINEVLYSDRELRRMIIDGKSNDEIKDAMRRKGFKTMLDDGVAKVRQGLTTFDELKKFALDDL